MFFNSSHHFRKTVAGACMVLAPLFLLISAIVHPETSTSSASHAAAIAADPDAWYVAHLFALASLVLAVPAVLGLMHMLRERRVVEGHAGGGLALLGLLAFVGVVAMELVFWRAGDEAATAALIERVGETTGIAIPFFAATFGFAAGMAILGYGLWSAHAVNLPMAACLGAGAILLQAAWVTATGWLMVLAAAVLAIGFGATGFMVLGEPDADWEHTPEFRGVRPAGGAA